MKHLCNIALASAAIICGSNSAANAEKWSCEMATEMEMSRGETHKQEWIVSDKKMFAPKGNAYFQVDRNDNDILFAFVRFFEKDPKTNKPINEPKTNIYVMIVKKTGMAIEFDDILPGMNYGFEVGKWIPPVVEIGHCTLVQQ
jgi:hypothetical protein